MHTVEDLDRLYPEHLARLKAHAGRALAAADCGALAISAGRSKYRFLDDQPDPFIVNPHFKAWVPVLDAPGSMLVFVPGRKPTLLFHQPEDYWHKPPGVPDERWVDEFDLHVIRSPADARSHIPPRAAFIGEPFPDADEWGFAATNPPLLLDILHFARAAKSPYEITCMRLASLVGARAHRAAVRAFEGGASEYEIHLEYLAASGHQENELPYPNIIALNEHAAILHYTDLKRSPPGVRRSFLIDAGGQFRGYAADITRTYAAATSPFADLLAGVEALQLQLCAMVVPGASYPDIHLAAHRLIGALLAELGIIRCSGEAAVETGLTSVFFPHGVGHLIGLQVHDVAGHQAAETGGVAPPPPGHPYLRLTRRLEAGAVVTIEPGVYFIDLLLQKAQSDGRGRHIDWDSVSDLAPYGGVRIEDNVVATAAGPDNLTRAAFAAAESSPRTGSSIQ
jgi:Xaa-Pro dipeptidase